MWRRRTSPACANAKNIISTLSKGAAPDLFLDAPPAHGDQSGRHAPQNARDNPLQGFSAKPGAGSGPPSSPSSLSRFVRPGRQHNGQMVIELSPKAPGARKPCP